MLLSHGEYHLQTYYGEHLPAFSWFLAEECFDRGLRDCIKVQNNLARDHLTEILIGTLSNDDSDV